MVSVIISSQQWLSLHRIPTGYWVSGPSLLIEDTAASTQTGSVPREENHIIITHLTKQEDDRSCQCCLRENQGDVVRDPKAARSAEFQERHTELLTPELSLESWARTETSEVGGFGQIRGSRIVLRNAVPFVEESTGGEWRRVLSTECMRREDKTLAGAGSWSYRLAGQET